MNRLHSKYLVVLCMVLLVAATMFAGCTGDTGPAGANGTDGSNGTNGQDLTEQGKIEQCLVCHAKGGMADIAAVHAEAPAADPVIAFNGLVDIRNQSATTLPGLNMTGTVDLVTITSGTVVVNFTVKDAANRGVIGLGQTYAGTGSSAGQTLLNYLRFAIVKLVPGTSGSPDQWASYMVTSTSRPSTENRVETGQGVLVDNNNGTYTYTFAKNIASVSGVTYDANATHRIAIQVSGGSSAGYPNIVNPLNIVKDFVPSAGVFPGSPTSHDVVTAAACNTCHYKIGVTTPHSGRNDTKFCVVCHTSQRGIGRAVSTPTSTGLLTGSQYIISGQTGTIDGFAGPSQLELVTYIHKIHMGDELALTGYSVGGVAMNEVKYPQDRRNCVKCHNGPDGDNWKNKPGRKACGSCHDSISFVDPAPTGFTLHGGGAQTDDSQCATCHGATTGMAPIVDKHVAVVSPDPNSTYSGGTNANTNAAYLAAAGAVPTGADVITYDVKEVVRDVNKHPAITFALKSSLSGTVVFNTPTSTTSDLMNNFVGSPSVYFAFAVPQDGITAPADFNVTASGYIKNINNGAVNANTSTSDDATITGPDAGGYYTITLAAVTVPDSAVMLTGGLGYTYSLSSTQPLTQTNLADYPYSTATKVGGLIVPSPNVWKVATGYTGRRSVVSNAKCNACHAALGAAPTFHAGQRNDAPTCSFCHNPNRTSSGWSANVKDFVHGIHGASQREVPFNWHAVSATEGFWDVTYPGRLNQCDQCHLAGTYDFSASAYTANNGALLSNLLLSTVATGTYSPTSTTVSPYVTADGVTNYGSGFSFSASSGNSTAAAGSTLVTTPITAACFACHDSTIAKGHMKANGGYIYEKRSTVLAP